MTAPEQRDPAQADPVEELRQRLQKARGDLPPPSPDASGGTVLELDEALTVLNAVCAKVTHPAAELAAYTDEQARPVVQRILDGELGGEAALALTRVVLDLIQARGEVKALEREQRPRVYREGDPMPDRSMALLDREGDVVWHDPGDPDWSLFLSEYGPLVGIVMPDYAAAVAADDASRQVADTEGGDQS